MVENEIKEGKNILIYMLFVVLISSIPFYFYILSKVENIKYEDKKELQNYATWVANRIYYFSNSNQRVFYFPRSALYKGAIYSSDNRVIFSLLDKNITPQNIDLTDIDGHRYLKTLLDPNVFDAKYLIVEKKISYSKLIINVILMLFIIMVLLFLLIVIIVRNSTKPYRKFNRYLEDFIKDAMHELKTPMGVILFNLDSLSIKDPNNKMIMRAKSALKNMIVVYEDLEFFVKNKKIADNKIKIDLSKFLCERVDTFKDILRAKKMGIKKDIQKSITIEFNQLELARIIDNTLSNAIKYSKSNSLIELQVFKEQNRVFLVIKDHGRGIKDTQSIFNRYYREDNISGGFGLGLNIVKNICDKNGVTIEVDSKLGEGSTFTYIFRANRSIKK